MSLFEKLKEIPIDAQSFLLLKAGFKPVIRVMLDGRTKDEEEKKILKIKTLATPFVIEEVSELYGSRYERPKKIVYLAQSLKIAKEAVWAEKNGDRSLLGRLLGYPACCVSFFLEQLKLQSDFFLAANKNTKGRNSFFCNNLFSFDARLNEKSFNLYLKKLDLFGKYKDLFLIRHVPCSFDCKPSMALGKKTLQLLKKLNQF